MHEMWLHLALDRGATIVAARAFTDSRHRKFGHGALTRR